MRLKHIVLTGYKTFASKTRFEFGEGITAVIGPNGSGKSNVADAIRWALGEQAFSLMRSKRTDDMIFAGSPKRARASMAEVLLSFDNSDGFFPVAYSEIELGRRAYRDGTNEYLLNGSRVRLREISDLLGNSGLAERNYTVIGQGAVDTALSQKPEERRALFEEAAGIISYRDRREDALRKLDETRHNLERAQDILGEIAPRLAQLERQATRAKQYESLAADLMSHLKVWFGHHYQITRTAIRTATQSRDAVVQSLEAARATAQQVTQATNTVREEQSVLRASLAAVLPEREEARRKGETAARELAVMRERAASFQAQLAALQRESAQRQAALEDLATRGAHAAATLFAAQDAQAQQQRLLDAAQTAAAARQAERAELDVQRNEAQRTLMQITGEITGAQNQANTLRQRKDQLQKRIEGATQRNTQLAEQRERELAQLAALEQQLDTDVVKAEQVEADHHTAAQHLEAARTVLSSAQAALAAAEAEEKLTSRMNLFAEMRAQKMSGDLAELAQKANLPGVRGTLGALLQVREEDQKAVAAALGEHMNAIVIDAPDGVTRTRGWLATLSANHSGRLRLVPLEGLRISGVDRTYQDERLAEQARQYGARPVLNIITAPEWLRAALQLVAGRVYVCRDLDVARTLAMQFPEGCAFVTRDGETAFSSGTLQLVSGLRRPRILGQPDEPDAPEDAAANEDVPPLMSAEEVAARRQQATQERDAAARELDAARRGLDEATRQRDAFMRESTNRRNTRNQAEQSIARLEENLAVFAGEIEQVEAEIAQLDQHVQQLQDDAGQQQAARTAAAAHVQSIEAALQTLLAGQWLGDLNTAHAALASAAEAVRNAEALKRERLTSYANAVKRRETDESQLAALAEQRDSAERQLHLLEALATESAASVQEVEARLQPIQAEMMAIEQRVAEADDRQRAAERHVLELESKLNGATLELERHQNELETLRERAVDAFIDDRPDASLQARAQETALENQASPTAQEMVVQGPAEGSEPDAAGALIGEQMTFDARDRAIDLLESLEPVEVMPEGTPERIQQLRNQIKRLGAINFEAQSEYDALGERAKFITEQANDLEQASRSLQQVIAELNEVMKATFKQTFDAIATHFQTTFKILFGGGQAKLTLTNAEDIDETGIDIQAQPPGKRPQTLALLSGGERSLTATALMFAILRVKPTPFCVLDEVDAALDESNVGRMRTMIESLADQTQFIIITHNRGTVEAANTIYGITMGADGASQVLSLRLDEVSDETIGNGAAQPVAVDAATVRSGAGWTPPQ